MKIVIAGASGFIGKHLLQTFEGHEVVKLSREAHPDSVQWDAKSPGNWTNELDGADVLINLAGAPVSLKWTEANRRLILNSRVESTSALRDAILSSANPPKIWLNASAVGYYGNRGDEILTEESRPGTGFLPDTCIAWENSAKLPDGHPTRLALIRTGIVLGEDGGALAPLVKLTRWYLGGHAGNGQQWMPWVHIVDLCKAYEYAIKEPITGPLNASAPNPVTNADFMRSLRHVLNRPWSPPVPEFALKIVGATTGPDASVILDSIRAVPKALLDSGYRFEYEELLPALRSLI